MGKMIPYNMCVPKLPIQNAVLPYFLKRELYNTSY